MNVVYLSCNPKVPPHSYWDHGLLEHLLRRFDCAYHELSEIPDDMIGAVVVIPARNQAGDVVKLNEQIAKLKWCVVILTGDEESDFPWRELKHPNMRVWVMSPKQGIHDDAANRIGSGYRYEQPDEMRKLGLQDRSLDWFFAGQITHPAREACAVQLRSMPNGRLVETSGFGQGIEYPEYVKGIVGAKFVPCPSGPATPDTFRLYEALEAGCIPIADGGDYWSYLLGETPPFPVVSNWEVLPSVMPELLRDWPHNSNLTYGWWQLYKRRMADKLEDQVESASGEKPTRAHKSSITVLVSTSPIPSHPNTRLVEDTIASVREQLPESEIIVMFDGVNPENLETKASYDEYTRRLLWKINNEYENITPLVMNTYVHQTGMVREALKYVRTPLLLFVEHDTPLRDEIDWDGLSEVVGSGYAHSVRLHHETHILPDHQYLMLDSEPQDIQGVPLIRTRQWSQRPHLSSTDYYRHICETYFTDRPMFIEHVMYGAVLTHDWSEARLHIYAPPGNMLRSTHSNGRAYVDEEAA